MRVYKILVTGPFNAGKTTFVRTLCKTVLSSEVASTDPRKTTTTSALDFGMVKLDNSTIIKLFGTPGQERFYFMVNILARGMDGYIFLVDLSDEESLQVAKAMYSMMRLNFPDAVHVIAANKCDLENPMKLKQLRETLNPPPGCPTIPLVAKDYNMAVEILREIVSLIKDREKMS